MNRDVRHNLITELDAESWTSAVAVDIGTNGTGTSVAQVGLNRHAQLNPKLALECEAWMAPAALNGASAAAVGLTQADVGLEPSRREAERERAEILPARVWAQAA